MNRTQETTLAVAWAVVFGLAGVFYATFADEPQVRASGALAAAAHAAMLCWWLMHEAQLRVDRRRMMARVGALHRMQCWTEIHTSRLKALQEEDSDWTMRRYLDSHQKQREAVAVYGAMLAHEIA